MVADQWLTLWESVTERPQIGDQKELGTPFVLTLLCRAAGCGDGSSTRALIMGLASGHYACRIRRSSQLTS